MDPSQQKEQFSVAYLSAVVAAAGYNLYEPRVDHESVDWEVAARGAGDLPRAPRVEVQLKCSGRTSLLKAEEVRFPLDIKNYNDLRRDDLIVPRILVVVLVPEDSGDWLRHSEDELALRHCGYWACLHGYPPTDNSETVTVSLPRAQQFTVEALKAMLRRINDGERP